MDHDSHMQSESGAPAGWRGFLKSRLFAIVVTAVALIAGLFLMSRFGARGSLLAGVGVFAFMMVGHSLMRRGHGSRNAHVSHGGHGGCGGGLYQARSTEDQATASKHGEGAEASERRRGCH
jgi:hypothetical protein